MDRTSHASIGSALTISLGPLLLCALSACGGNEPPAQPPPATTATVKPAPVPSLHDAGFNAPESVLYDATSDVYLVSNINGGPGAVDDNGYISRVAPDGSKVEAKWIEAGKNGVKLHAPKAARSSTACSTSPTSHAFAPSTPTTASQRATTRLHLCERRDRSTRRQGVRVRLGYRV